MHHRGESIHSKALDAKIKKNYALAADTFLMSASEYQSQGRDHDAAKSFEEAYKCFKMTNHPSKSYDALLNAAKLYEKKDTTKSIAARHYETIALHYKNTGFLKRSRDMFLASLSVQCVLKTIHNIGNQCL